MDSEIVAGKLGKKREGGGGMVGKERGK